MKSFFILFCLCFFTMSFESQGSELCTIKPVLGKLVTESNGLRTWKKNLTPTWQLVGKNSCEVQFSTQGPISAASLDGCFSYHIHSKVLLENGKFISKTLTFKLSDDSEIICNLTSRKATSEDALYYIDNYFHLKD